MGSTTEKAALREVIKDLTAQNDELRKRYTKLLDRVEALIQTHVAYQKWETEIGMDDECWNPNGDIMILGEERINELMALQRQRAIALNPENKELIDAITKLLSYAVPMKKAG